MADVIFRDTTGYTYDDLILLPGFISHATSDIQFRYSCNKKLHHTITYCK